MPNLGYWELSPNDGYFEFGVDTGLLLQAPNEAHTSSLVETPPTQSDSSPGGVGGCDDWVMPRLGFCLDISYDSLRSQYSFTRTVDNYIAAFITHKRPSGPTDWVGNRLQISLVTKEGWGYDD